MTLHEVVILIYFPIDHRRLRIEMVLVVSSFLIAYIQRLLALLRPRRISTFDFLLVLPKLTMLVSQIGGLVS